MWRQAYIMNIINIASNKKMQIKQVTTNSVSPNPNVLKKDNEKVENLAINLMKGIKNNRELGFQVDNEALIDGMNQAEDFKLVKRLQLLSAKYLKSANIDYKPYPEYQEIITKALRDYITDITAIIVDVYRANNPIMFDKKRYYNLIDYHVSSTTQDLFKNLEPLSQTINETGYSGL